jgi:ribosomal protein L30E
MNRSIKSLAAAAATTALIVTAAPSAHAQTVKITDKRADVVYFQGEDDETGTLLDKRASAASGVDVTSVTIKHAKKSLKITYRFAELAKRDVLFIGELRIKTQKNKNKRFSFMNLGSARNIIVYNDKEFDLACEVKAKRKVGKKGTFTITIPRKCLSDPKAIKLRSNVAQIDIDDLVEENPDISGTMDAVSPSKVRNPTWSKWVKSN